MQANRTGGVRLGVLRKGIGVVRLSLEGVLSRAASGRTFSGIFDPMPWLSSRRSRPPLSSTQKIANPPPDQVDQDLAHRVEDFGEVQGGVQLVGGEYRFARLLFCASISS